MTKPIKTLTFILLATFLLGGCITQDKLTIGNVRDVRLNTSNPKAVSLDVMMPIENDNLSGFTITEIDLDFFINGQYLGKIRNDEQVRVKGNSSQSYHVPLTLEIKNMLAGMMLVMNKSDKPKNYKIGLKGHIKARSFLVSKKVNIKEEDTWSF